MQPAAQPNANEYKVVCVCAPFYTAARVEARVTFVLRPAGAPDAMPHVQTAPMQVLDRGAHNDHEVSIDKLTIRELLRMRNQEVVNELELQDKLQYVKRLLQAQVATEPLR